MAERKRHEAPKADALYQWISYDLKRMKTELLQELNYSAMQVASLYNQMKKEKDESSAAFAQEMRYSYKQNQSIYDGLASILVKDVGGKLDDVDGKLSSLDNIQALLSEVNELKDYCRQLQATVDGLSAYVSGGITATEEISEEDCKKIADAVAEKTEENALVHNRRLLDAIVALPVPENVDYNRITDEVGDKLLEILHELKTAEAAALEKNEPVALQTPEIDYERIVGGTAEKVVESLPYVEKTDYARIEEIVKRSALAAVAAIDTEALASAVAEKISIPTPVAPQAPEIDYERLSDLVVEKLAAKAEKAYDVELDEAGLEAIAEKLATKTEKPEPVDYERIAAVMDEKLGGEKEVLLDEEGVRTIAEKVAEEICKKCNECKTSETETSEEATDELATAVVVAEAPAPAPVLVDGGEELVVRYRKSFTAKIRQSEENTKQYYSALKNELTSYKKIKSNISWNGDRFNLGMETVAKITIVGKTLCFYLSLDPNDPELKPTVYRQKDVGEQKKHEATPFMVKIKSDAGVKKAMRLIAYLAKKYDAEKDAGFEATDYVTELTPATDEELLAEGQIKTTKEKKVAFDF